MKSIARTAALAALVALTLSCGDSDPDPFNVMTGDEVQLAGDLYLPAGEGPFPTVLIRTPYGKASKRGYAQDFVQAGYAVVVRTRGARTTRTGSSTSSPRPGTDTRPSPGSPSSLGVTAPSACSAPRISDTPPWRPPAKATRP